MASGPAALAHGELAWLALMRQQFETALQHIASGLPWARQAAALPWREGGHAAYELQLRVIGIEVLLVQQQWRPARAAVVEALATMPPRRRRERLSLLLQRSRTEIHLGELEQARRTCDEAAACAAELDVARLRADATNALAEVARIQGDLATLERAACQAEELARGAAHAMGLAQALERRGAAAAARGDLVSARALWADAQRQYEAQGVSQNALDVRAELAELDRRAGRVEAATGSALAVLTEARGDAAADSTTDPWPLLGPEALLRCHAILAEAGRAEAVPLRHELQRRLRQQLAQLPDETARQRLLQALPHWRETARLCPEAA